MVGKMGGRLEEVRRWRPPVGWIGPALLMVAVAVSVFKIWQSGQRTLSQTELASFDAITLILSVVGSISIGGELQERQARRLIGPHGRSAFRRAAALFTALSRFQQQIAKERTSLAGLVDDDRFVEMAIVEMALDAIETQVGEQVQAANDAMEDWRDVIPEDIAEMERELAGRTA
jgi:hypothetical protein